MSKIVIAAAAGAGYVLGARAGRERFDQIKHHSQKAWSSAPVQRAKEQATDVVKEKGGQAVGVMSEDLGAKSAP
jgi:hypothetical protein